VNCQIIIFIVGFPPHRHEKKLNQLEITDDGSLQQWRDGYGRFITTAGVSSVGTDGRSSGRDVFRTNEICQTNGYPSDAE